MYISSVLDFFAYYMSYIQSSYFLVGRTFFINLLSSLKRKEHFIKTILDGNRKSKQDKTNKEQ